jgi:aminoglycoside phosphotransferase (APT) family kinase protein
MTVYDEIAETNGDDECRAWVRKVINAKDEIVAFVAGRLNGGGDGEFISFLKGSFNLSLCIGFGDRRRSALIRFAKPGHTTWRAEKVTNEVRFIEYLSQHTTIPLPRVRSWGLTEESPKQLGPFIIMDFINGTRLSTVLKQPAKDDQEDVILNLGIDDATLNTIYDQLADYMLQISRLDFPRIGAISKDHVSNTWSVTGRPLTYNMNELATCTGYPVDRFPTTPFDRASDYFRSVASEHLIHLRTQRNLADDAEDAQKRFIARHRFAQLIPKYCIDDAGPFKVFCDDMQPSNMLVDPDTLCITAVLDFEFTNTMPAQFAYDPPWWLLLLGPDMWLERYSMKEFLARYVPKMEQFLQALERAEAKSASTGGRPGELRLSARMRDSWNTKRFWFNYAARKSLDIDAVYWNALHEDGASVELLDEETRTEMELFTQMKMKQLKAYNEECAARFSQKEFE